MTRQAEAQGSERPLRGGQLHIDCFAGIAGDMFLGAMIDLGVPREVILDAVQRLPLPTHRIDIGRAERMGIVGCDVKVHVGPGHEPGREQEHRGHRHAHGDEHGHHGDEQAHGHAHGDTHEHHGDEHAHVHQGGGHGHEHGHHHEHRTWREIRAMIEGAGLPPGVVRRAVQMFERVAQAEGRLHGKEPASVAFHEVGAVDSIVDIVGAAAALDYLEPVRVTSRVVPLGHGMITCAHGRLPVPAPAALEILAQAGAEVEDGAQDHELCTPTGAAIVASCADAYGPLPAAQLRAVGYGAGDTVLQDRPNLLRLVLFEPRPEDPADREAVVLEANIDDMTPELCGHLMQRLGQAGARDMWLTPVVMKKGRPGVLVSALCGAEDQQAVEAVMLAESTTIGLRICPVQRRVLSRTIERVATRYGELQVKVARQGEQVLNAAPEFEICRQAAERHQVPLKMVYAAAMAVYFRDLADNAPRS